MKIKKTNKTFGPIVKKAINILEKNDWRTLFYNHGDKIVTNLKEYKKKGSTIKRVLKHYIQKAVGAPVEELQLYSTVGMASEGKKYSLRFKGQIMSEIDINEKGKPQLHPYKSSRRKPQPWHELEPEFTSPVEVCSDEARKFFEKFAKYTGDTKSNEHTLESLVLRSIAKTSSKEKKEQLQYIQPIKLGHGFFQLPTKLSASKIEKDKENGTYDHEPKFSEKAGGGIDIFARVKKGRCSRLAVIELKDKYLSNEKEEVVLKQAMAYATFVAYLLSDEKYGELWYNIFRGKDDKKTFIRVPNNIEILVMAMMPPKKEEANKRSDDKKEMPDQAFDNTPIELMNGDRTIKLIPCTCFLYFDEDIKNLKDFKNVGGTYSGYKGRAKTKK